MTRRIDAPRQLTRSRHLERPRSTRRSSDERAAQADLALALVAGPGHWFGEGQPVTTPTLAVGWAQVLSLVGLGTVVSCVWLTVRNPPEPGVALWIALTWVGVIVLAAPLLHGLTIGVRRRIPLAVSLLLRTVGVLLLVGMSTPLMEGWPILLWWPASVFLGTDVSLTMRALGRATEGMAPLWRVLLSPTHVVALAVVGIAALLNDSGAIGSIARVVVVTEAFVFAGYVIVYPCLHLMARYERELQAYRQAALEVEHVDRANWIHDDVLGELRLARVRLERGETSADSLRAELDGIEQRLRLKQVDEVLRTGSASVAEILQPFLRMARSHAVDLDRVPSYEAGALRVDETTGRLLKRAFAVPLTNAVLAGARSLAVDVRHEGDALVVEVHDDAGGFEPAAEHQGRGLDSLRAELGAESVDVVSDDGRTTVRCRVALGAPVVTA
jgi:signal transduction histidine kinase